ncbi:MAG: peptidase [Bacteroidota bacterium]
MLLFVFLDGVGLGPAGPHNPLSGHRWPHLAALAGGQDWTAEAQRVLQPGHVFRSIDATLGVEGLPQSGTGQAALFTGDNAPRRAGRHYGPYPHSQTKPLLDSANVFHRVLEQEQLEPDRLAFANAYPPRFFAVAEARDRWTVTTRACRGAGLRLRTHEDVVAGQALTADITGQLWPLHLGLDVPSRTPEEGATVLLDVAQAHACTLFEYYLTDKAGHAQDDARAAAVLDTLDRFLGRLHTDLDPTRDLLLLTSDHGNLEDLSTKSHTVHPVPLIAVGKGAEAFAKTTDLTHVAPALLEALAMQRAHP